MKKIKDENKSSKKNKKRGLKRVMGLKKRVPTVLIDTSDVCENVVQD